VNQAALLSTVPRQRISCTTRLKFNLYSATLFWFKNNRVRVIEKQSVSIYTMADGRRWNLVQRLCCNNSNLFYFSWNNPRGRLLRKVKIETHSRQTTRFGVEWRGYMLAPQVQREPWHCCSTRPHFPSFFRIFYEFIINRNSVNWISGCCWPQRVLQLHRHTHTRRVIVYVCVYITGRLVLFRLISIRTWRGFDGLTSQRRGQRTVDFWSK
jgi:hypothetical protein